MTEKAGLTAITRNRIDPDAVKVVERLTDHGYEAYLVGGCVRDMLLGLAPKDFDVATNATPEELRQLFRNSRIIGRRFRLAHIFFGRKIIETSTFRAAPGAVPPPLPEGVESDGPPPPDPSDTRAMMIWRDNVYGSAQEDALRRDFTVNGLFFDLISNEVLDLVGGLPDLEARLIRTIGDPDVRLPEDPVRILRAIKFSARLNLAIDPATREAMIRHRALIADCSLARVVEEIYKLLLSGASQPAWRLMHETGVLAVLFPEMVPILPPPEDAEARLPVPAIRAGHRRQHHDRPNEPDVDKQNLPPDPEAPPPDIEAGDPEHRANHETVVAKDLTRHLLLDTEAARELAEVRLSRYLSALDEAQRAGKDLPTTTIGLAMLFGCLADPAIDLDLRLGHTIQLIETLVNTVSRRLQLPRRSKEVIKHIFITQRRFAHRKTKPRIRHHDSFPEALQVLQLRHQARGDYQSLVDRWCTVPVDRAPRPHRHNRRRRRWRRPSESGEVRSPAPTKNP